MISRCTFLGLFFAFAFAVFETRAINTQELKDLSLTINRLVFFFNTTISDHGSATPMLQEFFITSAVEHDGKSQSTLKFKSTLFRDRLDNFTENMTTQIDILGVEDRLYIPKKTDPELILSIDGAAVPSPVTELDFPTEPSIEDKLRMLESTTINHDYHVMVYNKAYKGYYKSYKFPRPLKLRFKYTTPSLKYEYNGEIILRPEDFIAQESVLYIDGYMVDIIQALPTPKTIALSPSLGSLSSSSSSSPPSNSAP